MRTIKFRGLRTDGKGWAYGYYYEYSAKHIICWQNHSDNSTTDHFAEVIPESVGQFTGLHDKNGEEIYEGDILKDRIVVAWREDLASFALVKEGWAYDHYFGEAVDAGNTEIIGNIFENADLIK